MNIKFSTFCLALLCLLNLASCNTNNQQETLKGKKFKITTVYLIGDSTMADYTQENNYKKNKYPKTGWGQVFQSFMTVDSIKKIQPLIKTDSVIVDDRAKGGRSTRTFFQEGRWRAVFEKLKKDDIVIMQFGHNDASVKHQERFVNIEGYKEFLRLYVNQTRKKEAVPIILTPVARNYPWKDDKLENVHGEYDTAPKEIAKEMNVLLIDLNKKSRDFFTGKGKAFVSDNYFMNLPEDSYEAYPKGLNDNTHFQPAGAKEVARLVFNGLEEINKEAKK